ncbi:hypothetical protein EX895_004377 [Sporisorium graminicola]|uniref:ASTRA-associated protein 1 n=1 Tax=Sporisorium graminicola TaxID=280036 RepID=A0A4U7KRY6_9BASI|nr:hypothetical protein EX895_004377 [Sporisorium graminicola]TKY86737.1 hypothetical protein EX895_004377 [Sporisorium graminicola]
MNPKPFWILRHHGSSSIRSLHHAHHLLAVGDDAGTVSLVDLVTLRPKFAWTAHTDSVLTVQVVDAGQVITHARDNTLKLWQLPSSSQYIGTVTTTKLANTGRGRDSASASAGSGGDAAPPAPHLVRTIGVNALNFAKFSHLGNHLAVPNALDAAYIDILDLHTGHRLHEAIGRPDIASTPAGKRLPIVMSLHLLPDETLIAGYEDGYVKRWSLRDGALMWQARCHSESVMSVSIAAAFGLSVAADDRIARFELRTGATQLTQARTPGNACISISPDEKSFAVGAWDGSINVYSTSDSLSHLGSLNYHRDTVECLAFAHVKGSDHVDQDDTSDEEDVPQDAPLILAAGGRDGKVSLWKYH